MKSFKPDETVTEFHAHVYFSVESRPSAQALHGFMSAYGHGVKVHSMAEGSRGPHVPPMFGVDIPRNVFADVLSFLILNHGPHSVLIHPVSGNELLDHTHHALWLGLPQPLNLAVLEVNHV